MRWPVFRHPPEGAKEAFIAATYFEIPHAQIGIFSKQSKKGSHLNLIVPVDPGMIAIGGGVVGNEKPGKLLTASYPSADLSTWNVSAKDHLDVDQTPITGYAIGLRVFLPGLKIAMDRDDLMSFFHVTSETSAVTPHPSAFARLWTNCSLIGGGFKVNWSGAGSLATASYPTINKSSDGWEARAKDHVVSSPSSVTAFAIGLERRIIFSDTAAYNVDRTWKFKHSAVAAHPKASIKLPSGFLLTGGGGIANWESTQGAGSLLWKLEPYGNPDTKEQGFRAGSKDHDISNPCSIDAYVIGIRL